MPEEDVETVTESIRNENISMGEGRSPSGSNSGCAVNMEEVWQITKEMFELWRTFYNTTTMHLSNIITLLRKIL